MFEAPREERLRERIDALSDEIEALEQERDHWRTLAEERRRRTDYYRAKVRDLLRSRDYWKNTAGARTRKRLAA